MIFRTGFRRRMPMRRTSSFRSRFPARPRAFQRGKLERVQRAQFTFTGNITPTTGTALTATNVVFQLAAVRSLGEASTGQGRALSGWMRSIDIIGIHLDWGIDDWSTNIDFVLDPPSQASWYTHVACMVDRLDGGGNPVVAATVPWWAVQTPVAATASAIPITTAEDGDFPTRVLYERFDEFNYGLYDVTNVTANHLAQTNPRVRGRLGGFFKRSLRLRLNDEQGLYWGFSFAPANTLNKPISMRHWASGALYYRVNF